MAKLGPVVPIVLFFIAHYLKTVKPELAWYVEAWALRIAAEQLKAPSGLVQSTVEVPRRRKREKPNTKSRSTAKSKVKAKKRTKRNRRALSAKSLLA